MISTQECKQSTCIQQIFREQNVSLGIVAEVYYSPNTNTCFTITSSADAIAKHVFYE